jgi:hypothetical protein
MVPVSYPAEYGARRMYAETAKQYARVTAKGASVNERRGNPDQPERPSGGITRRDALKRGLKLAGAVAWATPVVQAVGMSPAFAQTASPVPCENQVSLRARAVRAGGGNSAFQWVDDPVFDPAVDCLSCAGATGVDGDDHLAQEPGSRTRTSVTFNLQDPACSITAITGKDGGVCVNGTVGADGMSASVSVSGFLSEVEVCITCCEDE